MYACIKFNQSSQSRKSGNRQTANSLRIDPPHLAHLQTCLHPFLPSLALPRTCHSAREYHHRYYHFHFQLVYLLFALLHTFDFQLHSLADASGCSPPYLADSPLPLSFLLPHLHPLLPPAHRHHAEPSPPPALHEGQLHALSVHTHPVHQLLAFSCFPPRLRHDYGCDCGCDCGYDHGFLCAGCTPFRARLRLHRHRCQSHYTSFAVFPFSSSFCHPSLFVLLYSGSTAMPVPPPQQDQ
mmetsp:Transcript_35376/g.92021  ORF Transcript_35376/g.92021 Transcript_35376/m.92021 type:complete len:239 (+) Transcript_35376:293-1009(+)